MTSLYIGTAGWSVPTRYAAEAPGAGGHLARYARRLNAVEINTSFYRPHQRKTYERWAQTTPADFRFAVKAPRAMTHERRLADCDALIERFADEIAGLGEKLAVVLTQTPPSLRFDAERAGAFFNALQRRCAAPIVIEPRHRSWFSADVDDWLAKHRLARVVADPAPIVGADEAGGWRDFAYYRWHGSPRIYCSKYDAAALDALRQRLASEQARDHPVWCVFDNTAEGWAFGDALALTEKMRS